MPSVGSVTSNLTITAQNSAHNAQPGQFVLANAVGGAFSVTLPSAPPLNSLVMVKKNDAGTNVVTVSGNGKTIDGAATYALSTQNASVTVLYDGSNWQITASVGAAATAATGSSSGTGVFQTWTVPGRFYFGQPATLGSMVQTSAGQTSLVAYPIRIPNNCTIATMALTSGTAGVTNAFGLYTDVYPATSGGPGVKVFGGVITTVAGHNSITVNTPVTAGNYWATFSTSSSGQQITAFTSGAVIISWTSATNSLPNCRSTNVANGGQTPPADLSGTTLTPNAFTLPQFYFTVS